MEARPSRPSFSVQGFMRIPSLPDGHRVASRSDGCPRRLYSPKDEEHLVGAYMMPPRNDPSPSSIKLRTLYKERM